MSVNSPEGFLTPNINVGRLRAQWRRFAFTAPKTLVEWISTDLKMLALWAPVGLGLGVGVYFGLKEEPYWLIAPIMVLVAGLAVLMGGRTVKIAVSLLLIALGFQVADVRTANVAAPILERELNIRDVTGRLVSVEEGERAKRFIIELSALEGVSAERLPARARVTWRGEGFDAKPGDIIKLRAGLGPPPPPAAPGTFDFARRLYFQKIGAVGYAVSAPEVLERGATTYRARIEILRSKLFHRITKAAPGEGGAIVAAIVTGKRDAISEHSKTALRDTGLAHLLAISGLHMGLATGLIFFTVRMVFASIQPFALKFSIKKWAALAALFSGAAYLILSGGGWSARRAFIMAAIMFAAILFDRRALSLRNVGIAACVILITTPEALFHAGFQMSFAAVTALIAGYEWMSRNADPDRSFSASARFRRYAVGLVLTDIIAALATAPYALYHFNRVALYSLPANVLAMPLMGFWIMPAAVLGLCLAPFGLDGWAWRLSATGVEFVLTIAGEVASWPGAVSSTAQWPLGAMLSLTIGGLVLCLWRSPLRLAGLAGVPVAAALVTGAQPAQIYVAASGLNAGVVSGEAVNGLAVYTRRRDRFSAKVWAESAGLEPLERPSALIKDIGDCDQRGCVMRFANGAIASFIEDETALAEDCAKADIVVAFFPVSGRDWRRCEAVLIDRRSVWRRGAHAVWVGEDGEITLKTVAQTRGRRPWTGQ